MEKKYNHREIEHEERNYTTEENGKIFSEISINKDNSFSCLLPPPNITGKLHLGHMWNCTIQDILLRFNYLQGKNINWLIGLDHAGISTQVKVEKHLATQITNFNSANYSPNWLKEQGNKWFEENKNLIINQWKQMGLLLDSHQITYTLDPAFNKLVIRAFVKLYHDGLIYKGKKMINWDVKLQTAISDLEVVHKTEKSKLYHLKYYLAENNKEYLTVATSRPETAFADACLFVNPHDGRYTKYIGKKVINPVNQKKLSVLADESVLIDFGTGVLKCTPAHDFRDYELGIKYNLSCEVCIDSKGYLNELAGKYQGLERFAGRKKLIEDLQALSICSQIETYESNISYSQRSNVIIEPYLSTQWFLNYREWIKKIEQKQGKSFEELLEKMNFLPSEYNDRLLQWKANLKDWCLSRQLWWGHQIPAWYHKKTGEIYVGEENPNECSFCEKREKIPNGFIICGHKNFCPSGWWEQETMALDTWFSSGLAPVFHSGYSENKNNLKLKLPISLLVTAYDILFFWVFKMICFSYYFTENNPPFSSILIHGLIRDVTGKKMSKSLGNVIDPEELIEKYGADAIRLSFVSSQSQDQDIKIQDDKLKGNWRFLDKIWNIARCLEGLKDKHNIKNEELEEFAMNNLSSKIETKYLEKDYLNCYFLVIFRNLVNSYNDSLKEKELKFSRAIDSLKNFIVWEIDEEEVRKLTEFGITASGKRDDFGNDYLEIIKLNDNKNSVKVGLVLFKYILRLLNPFVPFLTSSLYRKLYSGSLLLSNEKDKEQIKILVENLSTDNLEEQRIGPIIHQNCDIINLFYRLLRKVREFKNKYSLGKENLIIWLVLLPMKQVGENKKKQITYLTDNYKEIDFEDFKEKFNTWLKKLINVELDYIVLVGQDKNYQEREERLKKEKSVIRWKEELTLAEGNIRIFGSPELLFETDQEKEIEKTKLFLEQEIARCEKLLNDENFVTKAPKELVKKESEKLAKFRNHYDRLKAKI